MNTLKVNADSARKAYNEGSADTKKVFEALWPDVFIPVPDWNDITTFDHVLKALPELTEEERALVNYNGTNQRMLGARDFLKAVLITEAINQGWVADYDNHNQEKWEIIWEKNKAGFGFSRTYCDYDSSNSSVGSRLCFESRDKAVHAGRHFAAEFNELLIINKQP